MECGISIAKLRPPDHLGGDVIEEFVTEKVIIGRKRLSTQAAVGGQALNLKQRPYLENV